MCSLQQNTQSENDHPEAGESKDAAGSTDAEHVRPEVPRLEVARPTNVPSQDASHGRATAQTPPAAQAEEPHARNAVISTGAATGPPYAIPTSPVQLVGVLWPPVPTTPAGEPNLKCSPCSPDRLTTTTSSAISEGNVTTAAAAAVPAPAVFVARPIWVARCPPEGRLPPRDAFPIVTSSSSFSTSRVAVLLEPNAGAFKSCAAPSLVRLGCQSRGRPEVPASTSSCRSDSARAFPICGRLPRATAEIQTDISLPPEPEYIEDFDYGQYITRRIRLYQADSVYEAKSQLQGEGIRKMKNNTLCVDPACTEAKCYVNLLGWEIDLEAAMPGEWEQFAVPTPPYAFLEPRYVFQPVLDPDVFMSNIPESEEAAKEAHAGPDRARAHTGWRTPSATPHCRARTPRTNFVASAITPQTWCVRLEPDQRLEPSLDSGQKLARDLSRRHQLPSYLSPEYAGTARLLPRSRPTKAPWPSRPILDTAGMEAALMSTAR